MAQMERRPDPLWRQHPARSRRRVVAILVAVVAVYIAFIAVKAPGSCSAPGGGPCGAARTGSQIDVRATPRSPMPLAVCLRRERSLYEAGRQPDPAVVRSGPGRLVPRRGHLSRTPQMGRMHARRIRRGGQEIVAWSMGHAHAAARARASRRRGEDARWTDAHRRLPPPGRFPRRAARSGRPLRRSLPGARRRTELRAYETTSPRAANTARAAATWSRVGAGVSARGGCRPRRLVLRRGRACGTAARRRARRCRARPRTSATAVDLAPGRRCSRARARSAPTPAFAALGQALGEASVGASAPPGQRAGRSPRCPP